MTIGGWIFMTLSIGSVAVLTAWCFHRVLTAPPDDTTEPPVGLGP